MSSQGITDASSAGRSQQYRGRKKGQRRLQVWHSAGRCTCAVQAKAVQVAHPPDPKRHMMIKDGRCAAGAQRPCRSQTQH